MLISVVIPLYNKGRYVARALESLAAQTHAHYEAIIVDDGSTDEGPAIVRACGNPRVRLISQANAGPGAARNRGLAEVRGPLVAFLDADDAWAPGFLEHAVARFAALPAEVATVTCGYIDFPEQVSREPLWRRRGITEGVHRVDPATPPTRLVHMLAYMWTCSTVARTDVVRRFGGFYSKDGARYAEDAVLLLKILLNHPVSFHMEPLAHFHREASALSSNYARSRPVEPFLLDPEEVRAACPPALRPLLDRFYAARACKTALMLSLWGDLDRAQALMRGFVTARDWAAPFYLPARIGTTRPGQLILRGLLRAYSAVFRTSPIARARRTTEPDAKS